MNRLSAFLVGGRPGRGHRRAPDKVDLPPLESPDWDGFEEHAAAQTLRASRWAAVVLVAVTCLWWSLDAIVLHRAASQHHAFTVWRLWTIGVFATMYAALSYLPWARRHPALVAAPFSIAGCVGLAYFLGSRSGLEQAFALMSCAALMVPIVAPVHLVGRVALLVGLVAGLAGGFDRGHAAASTTPRSEMVLRFSCILAGSALIGHAMYVGGCHRYFQGLMLERTARELAAVNGDLGDRVRAKTAELRQLAEHLQVVQEDERARIARELHDELGQRLAAMRYVLATAQRRLPSSAATIGANLDEIDAMVEGALTCTDGIIAGLRPPVLEQLGLRAAVEWLAARTSERTGISCHLDLGDDRPCEPTVAVAAFRVLQESLTNTTRHAGATQIEVSLHIDSGALRLAVVDDGCGFPDEQARPSSRNGLLGMHERARALGGELRTDNAPTGGARVQLRLPVASATAEPTA